MLDALALKPHTTNGASRLRTQNSHTADNMELTLELPMPSNEAQGGALLAASDCSAFRCIVADPPWDVKRGAPQGRPAGVQLASQPLPYPTMTVEEICALKVPVAKDAHLYLWTTQTFLRETYRVLDAWGFKQGAILVWAKPPKGVCGTYVCSVEFCIFARRGSLEAKRRQIGTCYQWPRSQHSAKPEAFQDMVESVSPGPYLELFARRQRLGWATWGNEAMNHVELVLPNTELRHGNPLPPASGSDDE
jgi:N6-adenosine-specific RNA methylase IME4